MKKLLYGALANCARLLLWVVFIVSAVAVISVGLRFVNSGARILSVQTGSMQPVFRPGDALLVWPAPAPTLRVGQVISYHSARDPQVLIVTAS